jgi:hypothetical protein
MIKIKKIKDRLFNCFYDIKAFGFYIGLVNLVWPFIPRMPRFIASALMKKKHAIVIKYVTSTYGHIIDKYKNVPNKSAYSSNLPIWVCWLQGEENMPDVPKQCLNLINKHANGHPVIVISEKNYSDYISLPQYIVSKFKERVISNAHFTDIIRTTLLAEKGGCWIDSTILMTDYINEIVFELPFYSIKYPNNSYYVTENMWSNFFLVSHKNSTLYSFVRDMFYEYLKEEERFIDYFMMDYFIRIGYNEISLFKEMIDAVPINNIQTLKLKTILNNEYYEDKLDFYKKETYLFKLDWRSKYELSKNGNKTNWNILIH